MDHHRLPKSNPHPIGASSGTEIRFPSGSGRHNARALKEEES